MRLPEDRTPRSRVKKVEFDWEKNGEKPFSVEVNQQDIVALRVCKTLTSFKPKC